MRLRRWFRGEFWVWILFLIRNTEFMCCTIQICAQHGSHNENIPQKVASKFNWALSGCSYSRLTFWVRRRTCLGNIAVAPLPQVRHCRHTTPPLFRIPSASCTSTTCSEYHGLYFHNLQDRSSTTAGTRVYRANRSDQQLPNSRKKFQTYSPPHLPPLPQPWFSHSFWYSFTANLRFKSPCHH